MKGESDMIYTFTDSRGVRCWTVCDSRAEAERVAWYYGGTNLTPTNSVPKLAAARRARVIGKEDIKLTGQDKSRMIARSDALKCIR